MKWPHWENFWLHHIAVESGAPPPTSESGAPPSEPCDFSSSESGAPPPSESGAPPPSEPSTSAPAHSELSEPTSDNQASVTGAGPVVLWGNVPAASTSTSSTEGPTKQPDGKGPSAPEPMLMIDFSWEASRNFHVPSLSVSAKLQSFLILGEHFHVWDAKLLHSCFSTFARISLTVLLSRKILFPFPCSVFSVLLQELNKVTNNLYYVVVEVLTLFHQQIFRHSFLFVQSYSSHMFWKLKCS